MQRKSVFLFTVMVQVMTILPWQVTADEYPPKDPQAEEPPVEALATCAGKNSGDIIIIHGPQGEKRTAVCEEAGEGAVDSPSVFSGQPD